MMHVIASLLLQSAPIVDAADEYARELLRSLLYADRVALVHVREVTSVTVGTPTGRRSLDLAHLVVERRLIGPDDESGYLALATDGAKGKQRCRLAAGDRAVLFLHDDSWLPGRTDGAEERAIAAHTQERVWVPVWRGIWQADRATGEIHAPPGALRDIGASDSAVSFQETDLLARIERVIESSLPRLGADFATTSPFPWGITLDARGEYEGSESGAIAEELAVEILGTVRTWRDWPRTVGTSITPCESFLVLRLQERHGPTDVRVWPSSRHHVPAEDRARMDKALALWNKLPGARRPTWNM